MRFQKPGIWHLSHSGSESTSLNQNSAAIQNHCDEASEASNMVDPQPQRLRSNMFNKNLIAKQTDCDEASRNWNTDPEAQRLGINMFSSELDIKTKGS